MIWGDLRASCLRNASTRLLCVSGFVVRLQQLGVRPKAAADCVVHTGGPRLRFIYLGIEAGTQETRQDSDPAFKTADITENITLLWHIRSFKWELEKPSAAELVYWDTFTFCSWKSTFRFFQMATL